MVTEVYYFTATGNSLKAARDLGTKLENVKFISIVSVINKELIITEAETVGVVFPVYWFGLPNIVVNFLNKLKVRVNTYVFGLATCGSMVGQSLYQLRDLLMERGNHLSAGFYVKMPDNYQLMYKVPSDEEQQKYFAEEGKRITEIAEIIKRRQTNTISLTAASKTAYSLIYRNVVPKIYRKDKNFKVKDNCTKCGICSGVCPVNNITIDKDGPVWNHKCELCLGCLQWCPSSSIEYGRKTINKGRYHHPDIKVSDIVHELSEVK